MTTCLYCGNSLSGKQLKFCSRSCNQKYIVTNKRRDIKRKIIEYMGGKCEICGFIGVPDCYVLHHKDKDTKELALSKITCRSWNNILKELNKCKLLCANCHREIHYKENQKGLNISVDE